MAKTSEPPLIFQQLEEFAGNFAAASAFIKPGLDDLNRGQRAMLGAMLIEFPGANHKPINSKAIAGRGRSSTNVANVVNSSTASVERCITIRKNGARELMVAVENRVVNIHQAYTLLHYTKDEQRTLITQGIRAVARAVKIIRGQQVVKDTKDKSPGAEWKSRSFTRKQLINLSDATKEVYRLTHKKHEMLICTSLVRIRVDELHALLFRMVPDLFEKGAIKCLGK